MNKLINTTDWIHKETEIELGECFYCKSKGKMFNWTQWTGFSGHSINYHKECRELYKRKLEEFSGGKDIMNITSEHVKEAFKFVEKEQIWNKS